jgi:serine/threonine protein kinase
MGAVYYATDLTFDTAVAIKENLEVSPDAQRQFAREAGLLHELRHPHLPRVTDYFFVPGQGQYLVMGYVEGEDLKQVLARQGPDPEAQAVAWIDQVLDALDYLHNQTPPIMHRDVKPANVKIAPKGQAILVDLGQAKVHDPALSTTVGAQG